ncbi:MBL fold metallo-hydrolase [Micromonospora sp. CPCC 205539]|uniref:MBL fold metallo-hydrolase n=1 Tax=Micromonospora sp. CPCC 205539 TaxID=3122408 RepID=UPI002FF36B3F
MPLRPYACGNCGFWQRWFAAPPSCPVCTDVRNALPEDGWDFASADDVAVGREARWTEVTPGVTGYWSEPQLGLGSTGWVIETAAGLVGWEAAGWYPPEALARLRAGGGLVALGASHVHGYGALWQLQDELAPPVLAIGVDDLIWTKAFQVTWPTDERLELAPGLVIYRSGGHFPGHNVLHDSQRGILFVGDLIKVDLDGTTPVGISCHKAYHAQVPLSHAEVRQARDLVEQVDFEAVATPFEYAAPVSRKQVLALFDRQLAGQPVAGPIPIEELS